MIIDDSIVYAWFALAGRYDVVWEARELGKWLLRCHIPHHMTNDNHEVEGGGGLMMILDVRTA